MGAKKGLIFGSIPCKTWDHLAPYRDRGRVVIAADGGILCARDGGFVPQVYVGDNDSGGGPEAGLVTVELPVEKDLTDLQAAYEWAKGQGMDDIVFTACSGGRLDHHISAMGLLETAARDGIKASLVDERNEVEFLLPDEYVFEDKGYRYFSLIPVDAVLTGVSIEGAKYPLENAEVHRGDSLTVSNEFVAERIKITVGTGCCFFIRSN